MADFPASVPLMFEAAYFKTFREKARTEAAGPLPKISRKCWRCGRAGGESVRSGDQDGIRADRQPAFRKLFSHNGDGAGRFRCRWHCVTNLVRRRTRRLCACRGLDIRLCYAMFFRRSAVESALSRISPQTLTYTDRIQLRCWSWRLGREGHRFFRL